MDSMNQAFGVANNLLTKGQQVYHQQLALSKQADAKGAQLEQQSKVASDQANAQSQSASNVADIMQSTGSAGNLYQTALTEQNDIYGYNANTVMQAQQSQAQGAGQLGTQINQLTVNQGGNRGLSAAGVQAKAQSLTKQANQFQEQQANVIQQQENASTSAKAEASNEANAGYNQENMAYQSYSAAATQYRVTANNYAAAAQSEYSAAASYQQEAVNNINSFIEAALSAMQIGLKASYATLAAAYTKMYQAAAANSLSFAKMDEQLTALTNQEISYNKQQSEMQIAEQKKANDDYNTFKAAGVSGKILKQVFSV